MEKTMGHEIETGPDLTARVGPNTRPVGCSLGLPTSGSFPKLRVITGGTYGGRGSQNLGVALG